ncbi:MAG: hypothetical protein AMS27_16255 [Bacteroides sp. SM23_62_1]|nr:MAG: hypothetical protein AMS27_16255 [Bacteroides sp. SM23_62_1]
MYCDYETVTCNFIYWGGSYETSINPDISGINTSTSVGHVITGSQTQVGMFTDLADGFIDFTSSTTFTIKVWSDSAGTLIFQLENGCGDKPAIQLSADYTDPGNWQELTCNFTDPPGDTYNRIVMFFDCGETGEGQSWFFDDISGPGVTLPQTTKLCALIIGDTTWSDTTKILGDLIVADGTTLTIDPGTYVEFQGHYTLKVQGTLLAVGTETENIIFTINDTTGFSNRDTTLGGWNSIMFNNTASGANGAMSDNDTSRMSHCIIQYSKNFDDVHPENSLSGGAILAKAFSRLVISECRIRRNYSYQFGGGITCSYGGDIQILNCEIDSNSCDMNGGGIAMVYSNPIIRGNSIHDNEAAFGGGIYSQVSSALIEYNSIKYNTAYHGGGLGSTQSQNIIRNNTIAYNVSIEIPDAWWIGGGGIFCEYSIDRIENNIISNNIANSGGGINIDVNNPQVVNNLIVNNNARNRGAGLFLRNSRPLLLNNTITNNHAIDAPGGIEIHDSKPVFVNNILWGNTSDVPGTGTQLVFIGGISNPDITYSVVQEGIAGIAGNYQGQFIEVLESDPQFINPSTGSGYAFDGLSADWALDTSSNCLNSGFPSMERYSVPETDIYKKPRIRHGRIDIGASEIHIESISIEGSISKDTLLIADTVKVTGDLIIEDDQTLTIAPDTRIEFQGYFELDINGTLHASGTEKYPIIFTASDTAGFSNDTVPDGGWIGIRIDNHSGDMSDNDTTLLKHCTIEFVKTRRDGTNTEQGAIGILDFSRIRIQHCNIIYNTGYLLGGGLYYERSEPQILNCTISYNSARSGGAIFARNSEIIIRNCEISNNTAESGGGGIILENSRADIENNLIYKNIVTDGHGAGIYLQSTYGLVRNNRIMNNYTSIWGGGIMYTEGITASGRIDMIGNIICNNYADGGGGGLWISEADNARLINNTICNNESPKAGGGVYIIWGSPTFINNILRGNLGSSNDQVRIFFNDQISFPEFYHCNIQDSINGISGSAYPSYEFPFESIIDSEPHFVNPTNGPGLDYDALHADFSLLPISLNIDAGIEDTSGLVLPPADLNSNPRIHNHRIDIGALENQDNLAMILDQPGNQLVCEGDTVILQVIASDTVNYQWQKNGVDIQGAISAILRYDSITVSEEGNYRCIVSNAYGKVNSNQVYILVRRAPHILTEPESKWIASDQPFTLEVNIEGTTPLFYRWKKNGSLIVNANAPELTLPEPGYEDEGIYTCHISNACGVDSTSPATIYLAPQICMVTVDPLTGNNLVVWEKNSIAPISYYNIYRESKYAGIYDLLTTIPYDQLSIYNDSTADPTSRAYLYKITATDTSDYETAMDLCKTHKTIHLLVTMNPETKATQLDWDRYVGFEYGTYEIFRSDTTINFLSIDAMSSSTSTWSDPDPGTGTKYYRVAALRPEPCYPVETGGKKAESGPYSHSMSNMEDNRLQTGIFESILSNENLGIHPNPFTENTTLTFNNPEGLSYTLYITDISGKILRIVNDITTSEYVLKKEDFREGMYFVELRGAKVYRGKIIVE